MNNYRTITYRHFQVLQLIAADKTAPEIGRELGISERTVEAHRLQLKKALEAKTIAGLVIKAVKNNLIESVPVEKPEQTILITGTPVTR